MAYIRKIPFIKVRIHSDILPFLIPIFNLDYNKIKLELTSIFQVDIYCAYTLTEVKNIHLIKKYFLKMTLRKNFMFKTKLILSFYNILAANKL